METGEIMTPIALITKAINDVTFKTVTYENITSTIIFIFLLFLGSKTIILTANIKLTK